MARFNDDQIRAVILGPRSFRIYPFPGTTVADEIEIAVRVLTEAEMDGCRIAAQEVVRKQAKQRGWKADSYVEIDPHAFDRAIEREVVWRATFDSETVESKEPVRFFESVKDVVGLDAVTTTTLASLYLEHQEWVSPLAALSEDEVEALIEAMGKERTAKVFLGKYAPNTLRRFVITLASRLRDLISQTNKSDGGSNSDSSGPVDDDESAPAKT